jgi:hypothetical protein
MKYFYLLCLLFSMKAIAQPCNPLSNAIKTVSGTYGASNKEYTTSCSICNGWNSGNYSGWIAYDMQTPVDINSIFIIRSMVPGGGMTQYIDTSSDGVTWVTALNVSGSFVNQGHQYIALPSPWNNVRYIRLRGTGGVSWMSILEFMVNPDLINSEVQGMHPVLMNEQAQLITGNNFTFPMTIYASKASTYQWKLNGANIPGATNQSLEITQNGSYSVLVTYTGSPCNATLTSPAQNITGPRLWLKADEGAYTNNGINLATDGQTIQQWNDRSGNNFHATQADASKRPTWQLNAFNGKPALWFDGVNGNYWLENTVNTPVATAGAARTYFVVAKAACNATGYQGGHLFTNRRTPNASTLEFVNNPGNGIFHGGNLCCNHPQVTSVSFEEGQYQPFIGTWRTGGTNTNLDFWMNGTAAVTANANFEIDNGAVGYCVGDRRDAFQFVDPTGGYDWQGHIAEIIVYDRALSDEERLATENYLALKYQQPTAPSQFTSLPSATVYNTADISDAVWQHTFNTANNNEMIASIKSNCADLGIRTDTVYVEPSAVTVGANSYMRRHYVIKTSLAPVGSKRVRLYYTDADYADLQTVQPWLTSHSELNVIKYNGPNEDGILNDMGGVLTLIPSAAITTGTAFGQRFLEFDVTGFSEFWISSSNNAPLPVVLTNFEANKCNTSHACIAWQTSHESQMSHYELQQSMDGIHFNTVYQASAKNSAVNQYTFEHRNQSGKVYYRLQMIDENNQFSYSNTKALDFDSKASIQINPNPANNQLTVSGIEGEYRIELINMQGQVLQTISSIGNKDIQIKTSDLPIGIYYLKFYSSQSIQSLKVLIQH